ncbi:MAG: cadmium-translocating P-type ATPase, partial [Fimbriimonadaceae bacterium]|nr:cadmium-translocating P-type ATPase [Fimbriimonadaceae bacterium]
DESAATGESEPQPHGVGDRVLAGTLNLDGALVVECTAAAGEAQLDRVVSLVREAQENRTEDQRISAWFGTRYTLAVVGAFAVSLAVRLAVGQDWDWAIYSSLALFVALSPCALVMASPAASLSALAWGARNGLLIHGAGVLEAAARTDVAAFDKTGTLTKGAFRLEAVTAWTPDGSARLCDAEAQAPAAACAALESRSTHPLAAGILAEFPNPPEPDSAASIPGLGLRGVVEGAEVVVGRPEMHDAVPASVLAEVEAAGALGSAVALGRTPEAWVLFQLSDRLRGDADSLVSGLRQLGFGRLVMLTGDRREAADRTARELGLEEIHARLMPEDKQRLLSGLGRDGHRTLYVGDGVNDAPSLAAASVGVAMGGRGSGAALEAAHAVLMRDRLAGVLDLVRLGRRTVRITRASLILAASVVIGLLILTAFSDFLLSPEARRALLPLAVVGHEGSTVLVILNGLRLLSGPRG